LVVKENYSELKMSSSIRY